MDALKTALVAVINGWSERRSRWARRYWLVRAIPRSIVFNLYYLPPRQAIRMPVLVSHRTIFASLDGSVSVPSDARFGAITIGFGDVGVYDRRLSRTIWRAYPGGRIEFQGPARLGHGSKVTCGGILTFGADLVATAEVRIICSERIALGPRTRLGWEAMIFDANFHETRLADGEWSDSAPVAVGADSWIGAGAWLLPGARVPDRTVVGAGAHVTASFEEPRVLLAGVPARVVRRGIEWR